MDKYIRSSLIKEVAKRANFTVGDVRVIFNTFEEVLTDILEEKANEIKQRPDVDNLPVLDWKGIVFINIRRIKEHEHWIGLRNKYEVVQDSYRLVMKPSQILCRLIKVQEEDIEENNLQDGGSE